MRIPSIREIPLRTIALFSIKWLIRLTMLLIVPQRRDPRVATAWLMFIFMFPLGGLLVYLIFGARRLSRTRLERLAHLQRVVVEGENHVKGHPATLSVTDMSDLAPNAQLAENLGHLPVFGGNTAQLLPDYNQSIDQLVAAIDDARHHVHLLYYILADDKKGHQVIDALGRATERGVTCRVMVDALGSRSYVPGIRTAMSTKNILLYETLPVTRLRRVHSRADLRNHRKIAVIDGRVGFTGSQNIVEAEFKPGIVYRELVVQMSGPIVLQLQTLFSADWYLETGEFLDGPELFPTLEATGDVAAQVLPSGTGFAMANNQTFFVDLLHRAQQRVVVTTPYFIPDESLMQAMRTAAKRGVEVHLVVSAQWDQLLMGLAQPSYYGDLLESGVIIHEYKPKFLHAKHMSIDDRISIIGSSNMDIRSFLLNSEISMVIYDQGVAAQLRAIEEEYFADARVFDTTALEQRPLPRRLFQNTARLFSPLL